MSLDGRAELGRLVPTVYGELRALAQRYFAELPPGHTLQPTALVHEAFAKLADGSAVWADREHFLALAATVMRQVLADYARGRLRQKRGGEWNRVTLTLGQSAPASEPGWTNIDLAALDQALERLATLDERQARIVELRFLGGLSIDETAGVLGVSRRTVELDWRGARAWLRRELSGAQGN